MSLLLAVASPALIGEHRARYDRAGRVAGGEAPRAGGRVIDLVGSREQDAREQIAREVERALDDGPAVAVATVTSGGGAALAAGAKLLVRGDGSTLGRLDGGPAEAAVRAAALAQLTTTPRVTVETVWVGAGGAVVDRRSQASASDATVMVELFESPARLVIVGGGHIGLALARIGELLGFEITVLDDREEFANRERFPMAERVLAGEIDAAMDELAIDSSSYIVMVSRGHRQDELALRHALGRGAAFVGMIGSPRRTHTVLQHLLDEGLDRAALEAVHTPVGLDIGAETPEEIALSILAEVLMVRRGGSGAPMQVRRPPLNT
ncbi:MAG: hypothetical protein EXR65_01555 [Dehalococcoidia bacterium]|nr:hypothetical protein [Dehalococcoidia bacterium]